MARGLRVRISVGLLLATSWAGFHPVHAQDEVRDFRKPILVVETDGHHAPVRALLWRNRFSLLSAGEDKVVKVWDLADGNRLAQTIRPPIWRGPAGWIYTMALAPMPNEVDQSRLVVAGYGVQDKRGDMTVFRFPGRDRSATGEPLARLMRRGEKDESGHQDSVLCVAFDPSGKMLASGANEYDRSIIIWDAATSRPLKPLTGHTGAVRALAFYNKTRRLVSVGADGSIRVWDLDRGVIIDAQLSTARRPIAYNTVAISPDDTTIVTGDENGRLIRFDANNLKNSPTLWKTKPEQGPVEFIAFQRDGKHLAVSIKSDKRDGLDASNLACDLEFRSVPTGTLEFSRRVPGLVRTLAFSPTGDRLAYSGGRSQSIFIRDLSNWDQSLVTLKGQGATIFDLGFTADSQTIGFTHDPLGAPNALPEYEGFDLSRRAIKAVSRDQLQGAIKQYQGWTVAADSSAYRFEAVHNSGRRWLADLNRATDRLWWSYTFIPPGPGHPRPTLAIGCETGITVYDLETGQRTRVLVGHSAPISALAPSPDGRWLASGSVDQMVMFYPLAGCDTVPKFGASIERRGNAWIVTSVIPQSFARAMGLQVGDQVMKAGIASLSTKETYEGPDQLARFVTRLDSLTPGLFITGIYVRRMVDVPGLGVFPIDLDPMPSTKRNSQALTLFPGLDKEWIVWTPQGYYDTSIEGDSRFLGWLTNPRFDQPNPTDFVPISTYADTMRQPVLLDQLWRTANMGQALATLPPRAPAPVAIAEAAQPPAITIGTVDPAMKISSAEGHWNVSVAAPRLRVAIAARGRSKIRDRQIFFDERLLPSAPLGEPLEKYNEELELQLPSNRLVRLAVKSINEEGNARVEAVDLLYSPPKPPPPPPEKPRLVVVSLGAEQFPSNALPPVRFAENDVKDLTSFLAQHLIPISASQSFGKQPNDQVVLTGKRASAESFVAYMDKLREEVEKKELHEKDVVVLVVESHVLKFEHVGLITTTDTAKDALPRPSISAAELSERLEELANYGCRTIVFLDGVHQLPEGGFKSDVKEWVRDLQLKRGVITFIASKEGPSDVDPRSQHGIFAEAILKAFEASGATSARTNRGSALTLDQFKNAVDAQVRALSNRQQFVGCYFPKGVSSRVYFAKP